MFVWLGDRILHWILKGHEVFFFLNNTTKEHTKDKTKYHKVMF